MLWENLAAGGLMGTGLVLLLVNQVVGYLKSIPMSIYYAIKRRTLVTVEIPDSSSLLKFALPWVARQKVLLGGMRSFQADTLFSSSTNRHIGKLEAAPGAYLLWTGRRLVRYSRSRRMLESKAGSQQAYQDTYYFTFYFSGEGAARQWMDEVLADQPESEPCLLVRYQTGNGWGIMGLPRRPLGTVFLPAEFEKDIVADIRQFLDSAAWYKARGIPYRRGYMLHGEPGSGKTSLLKALCTEFGMELVYVPLGSWTGSEQSIRNMLAQVSKPSLVVMEDVDCLFSGMISLLHDDDDEDEPATPQADIYGRPDSDPKPVTPNVKPATRSMSFASLLNALDGVISSDGYILVMTTNHPEKLDPALIRPGRVDRHFYLGYAEPDQACRYLRAFYEGKVDEAHLARLSAVVAGSECSMAELQEVFLEHRTDPGAAIDALARRKSKLRLVAA